jgi:HNH endonuclease
MRSIPVAVRRRVIRRAHGRCEYCGLSQEGQEATFHIDHITPRAAGGRTVPDNLALACVSCSLGKASRQTAIDPQSGSEVPLYNPRRDSWYEHFQWEGFFLMGQTAIDGTEGHGRLLEFLRECLRGERIDIPDDFFDASLAAGRAVILFDGMDEVGEFDLRRRVARLIEAFGSTYPQCRMVVTSRIVGYSGAARLGTDFTTTTIRDFTLGDIEQFLTHWHRLVAIGQMGAGASAEHFAAQQTQHLMASIRANPRVRELTINPLMLTVIALAHRDRIKLPERRAEPYAEAVDVLLGKWDEARGVEEIRIFDDRPFNTTDRRLLLQSIVLRMHEGGNKEIDVDDLLAQLKAAFARITTDARAAERVAERFLAVINAPACWWRRGRACIASLT